MCQCGLSIVTNVPQGENVDSGGGCARMAAGGIWEIFVPSARFCCESKSALKNKAY